MSWDNDPLPEVDLGVSPRAGYHAKRLPFTTTTSLPSANQPTCEISFLKNFLVESRLPLATSQTNASAALEPESSMEPSGSKQSAVIGAVWPSRTRASCLLSRSNTPMVLS